MKYILPIIIASLLGGANSININHLKSDSEEPSAYDLESANDDPSGGEQDGSTKESKGFPLVIDAIKDKI
jgi:hypothetical protein